MRIPQKYHLNNDGEIKECRAAEIETCPFKNNLHFESMESVVAYQTGRLKKDLEKRQQRLLAEEAADGALPQQYMIFEGNMPRLESALQKISNKCKKYNCDMSYKVVGESFLKVHDSDTKTNTVKKFYIIEAGGTAKIDDWIFVASVEHTPSGNILHKYNQEIEIPARYYQADHTCEHCGIARHRKRSYIVMNEKTGEFKQVGSSCVRDFTNGWSAGFVASYMSFFDSLISFEKEPSIWGEYSIGPAYHETKEVLSYAFETIEKFGFTSVSSGRYPTASRMATYYLYQRGLYEPKNDRERSKIESELMEFNFDPNRGEIKERVDKVLKWLEEQPEDNNYIHNLKVATQNPYTTERNFGLLTSLYRAYERDMEYKKRMEDGGRSPRGKSRYIGEKGERREFRVDTIRILSRWVNEFSHHRDYTYLYQLWDPDGNIIIWKSSTILPTNSNNLKLKATIKDHQLYGEEEQTVITRGTIIEE